LAAKVQFFLIYTNFSAKKCENNKQARTTRRKATTSVNFFRKRHCRIDYNRELGKQVIQYNDIGKKQNYVKRCKITENK